MFRFSKFFLENGIFWGKSDVEILEKMDSSTNIWIVLKFLTSLPSGSCRPLTPWGARVIAFKWPKRPPPPKSPRDAIDQAPVPDSEEV